MERETTVALRILPSVCILTPVALLMYAVYALYVFELNFCTQDQNFDKMTTPLVPYSEAVNVAHT